MRTLSVESVSRYAVTFQTVNNLTVDDIHTYFVVVDAGKLIPMRGGDGVQRQLLQTLGDLLGAELCALWEQTRYFAEVGCLPSAQQNC